MTAPLNTSAQLQADGQTSPLTVNAGFTFTAGRDAILNLCYFGGLGSTVTGITIGGTAATQDVGSGTTDQGQIWHAFNITGGTTDVVFTFNNGAQNYVTFVVTEWASGTFSGVDAGTANTATGTSTAPSVSTAATTSQANTVVAAVIKNQAGGTNLVTNPAGWTSLFAEGDNNAHAAGGGSFISVSSAGVQTATGSYGSSIAWQAVIVAYKLAAGGPPDAPALMGQIIL